MDFVRNAIAIEPTRSKMAESTSLDLEPPYTLTVMYEQAKWYTHKWVEAQLNVKKLLEIHVLGSLQIVYNLKVKIMLN